VAAREAQSGGWRSAGFVATLCVLAFAAGLGATPAGAIVVKIGGHTVGVTPIKSVSVERIPASHRAGPSATEPSSPRNFDGLPQGGGPLLYNGGPVMHSVTTHVVYWDPENEFTPTTKGIVAKFFTDVAHDSGQASNVFPVAGQYTDGTGHAAYSSTFAGALTDKAPYPSSGNCVVPVGFEVDSGPPYETCLFDSQVKSGLSAFISAEKLATGSAQQYFVLFPHKVVTCFNETVKEEEEFGQICSNNFFCAYHGAINGGKPSEIIYSDIPFSLLDSGNAKGCQDDGNGAIQLPNGDVGTSDTETRFADVALKYTSHEYVEASTDPLGSGYFDANGNEIGDKCNGVSPNPEKNGIGYDANSFLPTLGGSAGAGTLFDQSIKADSYYLQSEWDNAAKACKMSPVPISGAGFKPEPSSGSVGAPTSFKGVATDIYAGLSFVWKWGDGTESAGTSPTHTYGAAGSYEVTMTSKDELTSETAAPVVHTIVVGKGSQTIAFTSSPPSPANVGASYEVTAEASPSKLPAVLTIDPSSASVCSIAGAKVEFKAVGPCAIDANQGGNANYNAAPQVQQVIPVKNGQTILFTSTAPGSAIVGGPTYEASAEAKPSGLPVVLTIDASSSSVCTISGSKVSLIGAGTCTVDANQGGDSNYNPAPQVQQSVAVAAPMMLGLGLPGGVAAARHQPNSTFTTGIISLNQATGLLTFTATVGDPGTFRWLLTFQNGKFGVFAASNRKCKAGFVRLAAKCRPSKIVFAKGSQVVAVPGTVTFRIQPSASAVTALKNALRHKKGLPVTATFTFQSARGGSAVSHTQALTVKLKKK
jgi:hypothetical protein